eukprot:Selendium_serpulae@DN8329_c0_g1_i1.p1
MGMKEPDEDDDDEDDDEEDEDDGDEDDEDDDGEDDETHHAQGEDGEKKLTKKKKKEKKEKKLFKERKSDGAVDEAANQEMSDNECWDFDASIRRFSLSLDASPTGTIEPLIAAWGSSASPLSLGKEVYNRLMAHQRRAVFWLWELFKRESGGILADDMGLGKTIQTAVYLRGLTRAGHCRFILLVVPLSLLEQWTAELRKWAPCVSVYRYHGSSKERQKALDGVACGDNAQSKGTASLLMTTFDTLRNSSSSLMGLDKEMVYRYVGRYGGGGSKGKR